MRERISRLFVCFLIAALSVISAPAKEKATEAKNEAPAKAEAGADAKEGADKKKKKETPFEEVIDGFERIDGLFTFYRNDKEGKVFMEVLPEQLEKTYLCSITRQAGDGYFFDSGAMLNDFPFQLKRVGKKIHLLHKNVYFRADESAAIHRAMGRGLSDSIVGVGKIEGAPHPERGSVLVDPTGFFVQDVAMVGYIFKEFLKPHAYGFDKDNSYFGGIKSFEQNSEIDVVLHFKSGSPKSMPTLPDARSFMHVYRYSLSMLPESDFKPRLADDRVGHFTTMYQDYTSTLRDTPYVRYVNRWDLQKAEPKFEKSVPREPIVFWLENTIPVEYRQAVTDGILVWNDAFERIGFKNAIVVKQQPDDAEWDAADVRYNTVRWIVRPGGGYAVGPSRTNPFTGQIYDADIRVSADMIRSVFRSYEEFAKPVALGDSYAAEVGLARRPSEGYCDFNEGASQQAAFGYSVLAARASSGGADVDLEKFINDFIVHVMAHEVGHTLGLRHNFKASTIHACDDLQTDEAARVGLTGSVMDYTPVNIAPNGGPQGHYWQTNLGPYDYWAIEYAYKPIDASGPESEAAALERIASRVAEKMLAYSTDEDTFGGARGLDPTSNRWDLGADPVEFYDGRVDVALELWANLEAEFEKPGERYQKLRQVFGRGMGQYAIAVSNVTKHIGGMYHHRDHVGDPDGRLPFTPVPAEEQRKALAFLTERVFAPDAFGFPPSVLDKLAPERFWDFSGSMWEMQRVDYPVHSVVASIQRRPLDTLYSGLLMSRILDIELRGADGGSPLRLAEMFSEVRDAIWAEVNGGKEINSFRRSLQRAHLQKLIGLVVKPGDDVPEDASTLARADLKMLAQRIDGAMSGGGLDDTTRAHLDETSARIEAALDAGIQRQLAL